MNFGVRLASLVCLLWALPLRAARERPVRAGPLAVVRSTDVFLPWTCTGTVDADAAGVQHLARIESDPSQKDGPWSLERLKQGLPCAVAASRDGKRALALVKTGESSYQVLFFDGDRLTQVQPIHGPWTLTAAPGRAFPPKLEQRPEGDAGFLYVFDANSGRYVEKKRRTRAEDD